MRGIVVLLLLGACGGVGDLGKPAASKAHSTDWQPGDEIPGWPEGTCERRQTADTISQSEVVMDWYMTAFQRGDGSGFAIMIDSPDPSGAHQECEVAGADSTLPCLSFNYLGLFDAESYTNALDGPFELVRASGYNSIVAWYAYPPYIPDDCHYCTPDEVVDLCVSKARPDVLEGVLTVVFAGDQYDPIQEYPVLYLEYPFRYPVIPHNSWDADGPAEPGPDCPAIDIDTENPSAWVYYSNYDTAWPWDDITDPFIRQAVYDLYYPCNL